MIKNIKNIIGSILHPQRLIYKNCYNNEVFVKYLREKGAVIGENTRFINPPQCNVDPGRLDYISIGNNCCLSVVTILAHDYSWYVLADSFRDILPDPGGKVTIGDNCFIGFDTCILKGSTIGDNVIIGARSLVKGNIPSNTVWAGSPAKQICTLEEFYEKKIKCRIQDAIARRDHFFEKYHRKPTIEEMGYFSFLFLDRNNQNYNMYIMNLDYNGEKNSELIKMLFFESAPVFKNFEEFLEA